MHDFLRFAAVFLLVTVGWVALIFYSLRALGWGLARRLLLTVAVACLTVLLLAGSYGWLVHSPQW